MTFLLVVLLPFSASGFLVNHDVPRTVTKVIGVGYGAPWGDWHKAHYCPSGSFAVGYNMKIEDKQGDGDDTSMNGLELRCGALDTGVYGGHIDAGEAPWGGWRGEENCELQNGVQKFLTAFSLQVEGQQGSDGDDTAANWIKFKCRSMNIEDDYDLNHPPGHGYWGSFGGWSESCPLNSAICGLSSRIESSQGSGDDTAFNDVRFYCCSD